MPRTSNKAEKIVEFVNAFVAENGYSPSVREIGEAVGLRSTASVSYHLQALQEKGVFQQPPVKGRKRALVSGSRQGQIPVIGMVTAGLPILAIENQEGTIPWEDPSCFALRVRGDSMINAGILNGDLVVVRSQPTANQGEIVVAMIDDEATVKRIEYKPGEDWIDLIPINPEFKPRRIEGVDLEQCRVVGRVIKVIRTVDLI